MSSGVLTPTSNVDRLEQLIAEWSDDLPAESMRSFLAWDFSPADRRQMSALAAKAQAGTLTPAEMEEAKRYNHVNPLLALLHSKARRALKQMIAPT